MPLIEETFVIVSSCALVINLLTMNAWVYLGAHYFVPLLYVSVFVPVPYCFDYCSFAMYSKSRVYDTSNFVPFFLRIDLAIWGLLWFHTNFRIICSSSLKNVMGI